MTALDRLIEIVSARIPTSVIPSTRIEIHPSEWLMLVDEVQRLRPMAESWESYEAAQERKAPLTSKDVTPEAGALFGRLITAVDHTDDAGAKRLLNDAASFVLAHGRSVSETGCAGCERLKGELLAVQAQLLDVTDIQEFLEMTDLVAAARELLRLKDLRSAADSIETSGSWSAVHQREAMLAEYRAKKADAWDALRSALQAQTPERA